MVYWILEDDPRFEGAILVVQSIREGEWAEDRLDIGCDCAFELHLN